MLAFDAPSNIQTNSVTSVTLSHTCTGSNLVLLVAITIIGGGSCTGVTYNGVSMTQADTKNNVGASIQDYVFILAGPAAGTHDIIASFSGTGASILSVGGISLTGADASPLGVTSSANFTSSASPSKAITTGTANSWILGYASWNSNGGLPISSGTNQTTRWNVNDATDGMAANNSTQTTTTAGSYTSSWANGPIASGNMILVEVKELVATATPGQSASIPSVSFQRIVKTNSY